MCVSTANIASVIILDLSDNTFVEITGLPSRAYNTFATVGNRVVLGSNTTSESVSILDLSDNTFIEITGLPVRAYRGFATVRSRVVCTDSVIRPSVVVLDLDDDSFMEIDSKIPVSRVGAVAADNIVIWGSNTTTAHVTLFSPYGYGQFRTPTNLPSYQNAPIYIKRA